MTASTQHNRLSATSVVDKPAGSPSLDTKVLKCGNRVYLYESGDVLSITCKCVSLYGGGVRRVTRPYSWAPLRKLNTTVQRMVRCGLRPHSWLHRGG